MVLCLHEYVGETTAPQVLLPMSDPSKVNLVFDVKQGLAKLDPKDFPASTTIGSVIDRMTKRKMVVLLPQQQLLLCVMSGSDTFMPAPDQSLGDLFKLFGVEDPQYGWCLKIAVCTSLFQG